MTDLNRIKGRKRELLEHYATGDVHAFAQLDAFIDVLPQDDDCMMQSDPDEDCIFKSSTYELRHSGKDLAVRILIHEGTTHVDAVRTITKLLNWLKRDPDLINTDFPIHDYSPKMITRHEAEQLLKEVPA